jgi:hypothetical protein
VSAIDADWESNFRACAHAKDVDGGQDRTEGVVVNKRVGGLCKNGGVPNVAIASGDIGRGERLLSSMPYFWKTSLVYSLWDTHAGSAT